MLCHESIFTSGTDLILLLSTDLVLFVVVLLVGATSSKKPEAPWFKIRSGQDLAGMFFT